jgi:hypothetical protein
MGMHYVRWMCNLFIPVKSNRNRYMGEFLEPHNNVDFLKTQFQVSFFKKQLGFRHGSTIVFWGTTATEYDQIVHCLAPKQGFKSTTKGNGTDKVNFLVVIPEEEVPGVPRNKHPPKVESDLRWNST